MIKFKKSSPKPNMKLYSKKSINLLPSIYEKTKKKRSYAFLLTLLGVAIIILARVHYHDLKVQLESLNAENKIIEEKIEITKEEKRRLLILYSLRDKVEEKLNVLKAIQNAHASVTTVFKYIETAFPEDIVYVNLKFDAINGINISGRTKNKEEIPDFLHKIREIDRFSDVVIENISRVEGELVTENRYTGATNKNAIVYYDFVFVCKLGGVQNDSN